MLDPNLQDNAMVTVACFFQLGCAGLRRCWNRAFGIAQNDAMMATRSSACSYYWHHHRPPFDSSESFRPLASTSYLTKYSSRDYDRRRKRPCHAETLALPWPPVPPPLCPQQLPLKLYKLGANSLSTADDAKHACDQSHVITWNAAPVRRHHTSIAAPNIII